MDLDPHLITTLVERWRPETHTFHLSCGEATVTLQDVAIIWGLPVRGRPVIGIDFGRSKEDSIRRHFQGIIITDDTDQMIVDQYVRGVVLTLLAGIVMPDSTSDSASLLHLRLLEDFDRARKYSWASASLATLYRKLCTASIADKCVIGGPCLLLQIWACSDYHGSSSQIALLGSTRSSICR
ncbi:serine/threonine-protein phosphatase 7 long form homolog [Phtheirospermum japonicum]|uniref:Serine/threonine-protein phosphatase 7 long form homolog n=1 Tax=Phtheirospermum japonicum TaxID=374723 RepID=A0A830C0T9_9LAMI|nr:serine/threonine-protein phosphatase 7 long form homolog [Phtheirospermum japonicum]